MEDRAPREERIRRVVTGAGGDRRATVSSDGPPPTIVRRDDHPLTWVAEQWVGGPSRDELGADLSSRPFELTPPPGGSVFRLFEFAPEGDFAGPDGEPVAATAMHSTASLDYVIVVAGTLSMEMEDGTEVELGPGDCVVQRGTEHAWHNYGTEPVIAAAVLISTEPAPTKPED
jgi:mannose-6-phosphate isomerase-like protein (cupin superfamily)